MINNSVHLSLTVTPFFFNALRHLRVPTTLYEEVERYAVIGQLAALAAEAARLARPQGEHKLVCEDILLVVALAIETAQSTQPRGELELVCDNDRLPPAHTTHKEGTKRRAA